MIFGVKSAEIQPSKGSTITTKSDNNEQLKKKNTVRTIQIDLQR